MGKYIRRTYDLAPSDDEILERHSEHLGCSKSAMLRIILRDWNVKAGRTFIDPPVGYHADRPGQSMSRSRLESDDGSVPTNSY